MRPDPAGQEQPGARTWRAPKAIQERAQGRGSVLVNPCSLAARSASRREDLILENIEHVRYIAKRLQRRVRCVLIEDLVGAGTVGLIQAVDRFDSSLGARFRSYASHRILGAMLDYLREQDPIGRDERRRMRTAEGATGFTAHSQPSTISLDGLSARALNTALRQSATRFPDVILRAELNEGRQALLPQEHRVIMLLFDLEWKGCDVARALGVTGGRISQIRRNAFAKLRSYLGERTSVR